jgi:GDP-D-mannose dehydratase
VLVSCISSRGMLVLMICLCACQVEILLGDPAKAKRILGWTPQVSFEVSSECSCDGEYKDRV